DEDEENDDNGENAGEEEDTYLSDGVEEEDDDSDFGENILNGLEDSAVVEDCSWSVSTCRLRGKIDSNGVVAAFLEERLNMGVNFILSTEVITKEYLLVAQ
ncbi:Mitochondrial import receptor subunit TOM40-1, partial [Ananas comosus]